MAKAAAIAMMIAGFFMAEILLAWEVGIVNESNVSCSQAGQ
jgi:hypothetical protein